VCRRYVPGEIRHALLVGGGLSAAHRRGKSRSGGATKRSALGVPRLFSPWMSPGACRASFRRFRSPDPSARSYYNACNNWEGAASPGELPVGRAFFSRPYFRDGGSRLMLIDSRRPCAGVSCSTNPEIRCPRTGRGRQTIARRPCGVFDGGPSAGDGAESRRACSTSRAIAGIVTYILPTENSICGQARVNPCSGPVASKLHPPMRSGTSLFFVSTALAELC